ncbi:germination protein YpeB [Thalassobacillus devorans]|uniref:germination protein YpeB n=1 Tax=Thalassobacillus devorans TaxID=279813 RepID=UPI000A1CD017|nr:germination protein YpeB [Thalassobacillus devorans]
MKRWILISLLAIVVVGTGVWGYKEHQDKNAILIQAENTYQRAFHDLTYHTDLLHDKIGNVLAMNSQKRLSPELAQIWRLTSEAQADVGQLPLTLLPFNKTEEFLHDIGDFSYKTAIRNLSDEPLSDEEVTMLEDLYKQSGTIKDELRKVQHTVLEENLRWMDVQLALATNDAQGDNTIIDGFETVEKSVAGFGEENNGSNIIGIADENHEFKGLDGKEISEQEAKETAKKIFNIKDKQKINMTKTGDGADVQTWMASYQDGDKNGYIDMSVKGGHPLTVMVERPVKDTKISLHEGALKANDYLQSFDFPDRELVQSSQYEKEGVYSFVASQDGVRIYPDAIQVKVALDSGDMLGMSAKDYFMNHRQRDIPETGISEEEARSSVNPDVKIQEQHMAIIENDLAEEVLTYEFLGTLGDNTYRIFINAEDGTEEKVERLKATEIKFSRAV